VLSGLEKFIDAAAKKFTANWHSCSKDVDLIKKRPDKIRTKYCTLNISSTGQLWRNVEMNISWNKSKL
jgi:hypothetical protein